MRTNTPSSSPPAMQVQPRNWAADFAAFAPWLGGLLFFALYAATAAPSLVALFDDSLEFQLVLPIFAIAHPTGYPLYTLLGGLWSRVLFPFGSWAWRTNLFSALAAAAATGVVFALGQQLATGGVPHGSAAYRQASPAWRAPSGSPWLGVAAGAAAALVFGLGPVWSAQATLAEVYALHNLLLGAVLLVTLAVPRQAGRRFEGVMALLALLIGLGLAHHRTIVLALPGMAVYLLWSVPGMWRPQRAWLLWLGALLAPLLLYLYLPLRAAVGAADLHGSYTNTWNGFWDHVLARGYAGFFSASPLAVTRSFPQWFELLLAQVGWLGLALAVIGVTAAFLPFGPHAGERTPYWSDWRKGWLLVLLVLAVNLTFALFYRVADQEVFLLPVFLCLALLAGGGVAAIGALLLDRKPAPGGAGYTISPRSPHPQVRGYAMPPRSLHPQVQGGWAGVAVAALVALLLWNPGRGPLTNRAGAWTAHDYAVDMAKVPFEPGSTVIGLEGEVTALKYMQAAEGLGMNAAAVAADDPQRRRAAIAAAVAAGAPTYLTRELEGIAGEYSFSGDGSLVRVFPRGKAEPGTPQHALDLPMDDGRLLLKGYDLQRLDWAGGPALRVNLYWQPTAALPRALKVSLRLLSPDGSLLAYGDGAPATLDQFPLRQVAPTTTWLPGETVRDVYTLYLPPAAREQLTTLQLILYDAETVAEVGRWETVLPQP